MKANSRSLLVLASALFLFVMGYSIVQSAQDTLSADDKSFMKEAAGGGIMEVKLGEMALGHASSDDVKSFGRQMVNDHSKANQELMQLAEKKGVTLSQDMDSKHKDKMDKLSKLHGAEFDREYMSFMVEDHQKDVEKFKKEASNGQDSELKAFASKTTPVLQTHLKMATDIHSKVGKK